MKFLRKGNDLHIGVVNAIVLGSVSGSAVGFAYLVGWLLTKWMSNK